MELTPDKLKQILMDGLLAQLGQMQKDLEVRIATMFKVRDVTLPNSVLITIAETTSREIMGFVEQELVMSKRIERVVDKLL